MSANVQDDFQRIRTRLGTYYRRHEIDLWLRSPHPMLRNRRACDLINAGEADEVERILDLLDADVHT